MTWSTDNYHCSIKAKGYTHSTFEVGCGIYTGRLKKKVKLDGREIEKLSDYYGKLLTVVFSPVDINIINGSPDLRRKFIDSVISKTDPRYLDSLNEFKKILASRNKILRLLKEKKISDTLQLDAFDRLFAEKASFIIKKREYFINEFKDLFAESYKEIAVDDIIPGIFYSSSVKSKEENDIFDLLKSNRIKDIYSGSSSIGPQRDEIKLQNEQNIRFTSYASQGQRRTAAISLKASESIYLERQLGQKAVILVDDIFSELDEKRRANMVKILGKGNQVIFTMVTIDSIDLSGFKNVQKFIIEKDTQVRELV